jgi:hypothetical protein
MMLPNHKTWPDTLQTNLAPGYTLVPVGPVMEVEGELWMSYVPDEDDESGIIVERSETGRLRLMRACDKSSSTV